MRRRVDGIFVGPQRTGTSWIYEILKALPQVVVPLTVKETFYFDRYAADKDLEWYHRHFPDEEGVTIEVAPTYFHSDDAMHRLFAYNPDMHLFVTLRDPCDRLKSLYDLMVRNGDISRDIDVVSAIQSHPYLGETSNYHRWLTGWLGVFPANQVHVLYFEDVCRQPESLLNRLQVAFDRPFGPLDDIPPPANISVSPRFPRIANITKKLVRAGRRKGLHALINIGKSIGLDRLLLGGQPTSGLSLAERQGILDGLAEYGWPTPADSPIEAARWQ